MEGTDKNATYFKKEEHLTGSFQEAKKMAESLLEKFSSCESQGAEPEIKIRIRRKESSSGERFRVVLYKKPTRDTKATEESATKNAHADSTQVEAKNEGGPAERQSGKKKAKDRRDSKRSKR